MRILVLNYEHPPLGGGGGRLSAKVAAGLVRRGHAVRILTGGMPHLPEETLEDGVEVRRLRSGRRREDTCSIPEMGAWVLRAIPAAIAEARRWKPDVIHVHFAVPTGPVAWAVHRATGIPYVLTAHLGDVPGGVPEQTGGLFHIVKPFTDPIWGEAAATTAVSGFVAELARKAYGISPEVILNGMTLPPSQDVHDVRGETISRLLFVGRMSVQKNPLTLIRALALLRDLPWSCVLCGEGPLAGEVRSAIEQSGLGDRITCRGWVSSEEVSVVMKESSILVIPSLSEGLPMVGIEAVVNGLAIVGSRIAGLSDVADEGNNASLFDLKDGAEGLATALRPYLESQTLLDQARMASLAISCRFDLERSLDAYERTLARVAKNDVLPS